MEKPKLPVSGQEEKDLGLECKLVAIVIEAGQKRVILHLFKKQAGFEFLGEKVRQARFSDADGALNDDIPSVHGAMINAL